MIDQTAEALIYLGNRAVEQGNDGLARWLYEEGLAIWRAVDDAPYISHALERLRMLEGNPPSMKWAGARERSSDTGTPAGSEAPPRARHQAGG